MFFCLTGFVYKLILCIIVCLLLTLFVASLTFMERKVLSLIQRRIGPHNVGYRGRLQYIADAVKLLAKGMLIPNNVIKTEFFLLPFFALIFIYTFWLVLLIDNNIFFIDLEYTIGFINFISILFAIAVLNISVFSKNKFSLLAGLRYSVITLNNELLFSFLLIFFTFFTETLSLNSIDIYKYNNIYLFLFSPIILIFVVCFLSETGRNPFDFGESESELIAGYTTELSGFLFVLYYLGEYFHLLILSNIYAWFIC